MDESRYSQLADQAYNQIQRALEPVDPDEVDYELRQDVLEITFPDGAVCVINTQRPTRQIWMAWNRQAWHFGWDEGEGRWLDDKGTGVELFSKIRDVIKEKAGVEVSL